ncbi:MAG: VOC family protein [Halanaerobium sp.]
MLNLGSTYLIVKDMKKSISFYEKLLEMKVSSQNYDRWAQFNFGGNCIALWNPKYDEKRVKNGEDLGKVYNQEYLSYRKNDKIKYGNNFVLNFWIDDLKTEYERLKNLNISKLSEIMFINVASPYYFFMLEDPDGNKIEITGNYSA